MARPGIEPRIPDLRVRCPTDCATRPGQYIVERGQHVCMLLRMCKKMNVAVDSTQQTMDRRNHILNNSVHYFVLLHGPPLLNDRPILVKCSIITPTFIALRNHQVIGQLNEYHFLSVFHWSTSDTSTASQCMTVQ